MWKERLWQVFLVAILGSTLTMCSRSSSNNTTSSTGTLNADGTSTVIVSSLPSITLANVGLNAISHTMMCTSWATSSDLTTFQNCDATDDTVFGTDRSITLDGAHAAGWKLVGPACGGGWSGVCVLFHK